MDKQLSHGDNLLADFLETNLRAALKLYADPRRRYLLNGEDTVGGALAYLLSMQLAYRTTMKDDHKTEAAIKRREKARAEGRPTNGKVEHIPYLGVKRWKGGGYRAVAVVSPGGGVRHKRTVTIGFYETQREAALAYDAYMLSLRNGKQAKTNANTGRL